MSDVRLLARDGVGGTLDRVVTGQNGSLLRFEPSRSRLPVRKKNRLRGESRRKFSSDSQPHGSRLPNAAQLVVSPTVMAIEAQRVASRLSPSRGPRMPANWITERPIHRMPRPMEAPRLQLPLHQPAFEQAKPSPEAEHTGKPERGTVVVDFYI